MLRIAAVAGLMLFSSTWILSLLERYVLYAFDPTVQTPAEVGLDTVQWREFYVGENMHVLWTAPPKPNKPTIVYFHGNAGNLSLRNQRFNRFVSKGYGLVALAYSGSSGSQGTPSQANIINSAHMLWTDIDTYSPKASPKILYGESIGSAVALHLVGLHTADPAALILEAPFTNLIEVGTVLYPQLADVIPQVLNDTWDNTRMAPKITQPLLIIHGTDDALIPQRMGRTVFGLAQSEEKNFYSIDGVGHLNTWTRGTQNTLLRFIDTYGRP